jgi:hypothetical protein
MAQKKSNDLDIDTAIASRPVIGIDVTSALSQQAGIGRYTRELISSLVKYDPVTEYVLFSAKQPSWDRLSSRIDPAARVRYKQAPLSESIK